jgi:hypothetical protein
VVGDGGWEQLSGWCIDWLGSPPTELIFEAVHLSRVTGVRLVDGRRVVVKVRPAKPRDRGCWAVQGSLWAAGFPCPRPLVGPVATDPGLVVTVEDLVAGGHRLPRGADAPALMAGLLSDLVAAAPRPDQVPSLDPPPAWIWPDHPGNALWPTSDDTGDDFNATTEPAWLDALAAHTRARVLSTSLPPVVGHGDWRQENVVWRDRSPLAVHDWDSVVARPEAVLAGAASLAFPNASDGATASVHESEAFLDAYARARGRPWPAEELEICWAAGLWVFAYNAKVELLSGGGPGPMTGRLRAEAAERRRRAGLAAAD